MAKDSASAAEGVGGRIGRLRAEMRRTGTDALLITNPENRRYFSGFEAGDPMLGESSGALVVTARRLVLATDSRFTEIAAKEAPDYRIVEVGGSWAREVAKLLPKGARLAYEADALTVNRLRDLERVLGADGVAASPFDPASLRVSKSPEEIRLITRALRITEEAVGILRDSIEPGWTEERAARLLDQKFRDLGGEGPAFETIVAAGPRASLPHAVPGRRKVRSGELVVVDCGARYKGYASDITRTLAVGEPAEWLKAIYRTVRLAQLRAMAAIAAGVPGLEVDAVARRVISDAGYGAYFGHGLGHGVGLAVHEAPRLSPRALEPLPAGAVVTVEPGIYLPGRGGVRLEQLVVVTGDGCRVLNRDRTFYDF